MHWNGRQLEHTTHAKQDEKKQQQQLKLQSKSIKCLSDGFKVFPK